MKNNERSIVLQRHEMPTRWYNIAADLQGKMLPPLHPGTMQPLNPNDMSAIFPELLIEQETSSQRWIHIPEEVLDLYSMFRPSPLFRARNLEKLLDTPAKIYYKYEGVSPSGSHKTNTAIAQAYYNKREGVKKLVTETGAGQWGSALAFACKHFGISLEVFMVSISYLQKPYRKMLMKLWEANVHESPSSLTQAGKNILAEDPSCSGSLGIAISEAMEIAANDPTAKYALGSVLNHVLLHQTIIGLEAVEQFKKTNDYPDVVIGCFGGGSNFAGISFPFLQKCFYENRKTEFVAVEPASCPKLTKGLFRYDFGDVAGMTPLLPMHTLGHDFIPPGIHAGGLRYHGAAPLVSALLNEKHIQAESIHQLECFEAGILFAQTEGILPAPESTHAIAYALQRARLAKEEGNSPCILFNLSGHGYFDMASYEQFFENKLINFSFDDNQLKKCLQITHAPSVFSEV
ncbi:MAG: TrpB-like pyridoxal phosphate-dependent enzyme [Bacteroidota bacterium]